MRLRLLVLTFLLSSANLFAATEDLNFTIKGQSGETPELETLTPSPDIPGANSILFSLDGGKSAREGEIIPLKEFEGALLTEPSKTPYPTLPLIPAPPFISQKLPIGDQYDSKQSAIFYPKKKSDSVHYQWDFKVFDDKNKVLFTQQGEDRPPDPLIWDGMNNGEFLLSPNRTYITQLTAKTADKIIGTWTGEAIRCLGMVHKSGNDVVINFGERLYNEFDSNFSPSGRIFLNDLSRRLYYHIHRSYAPGAPLVEWEVTLYEPPALIQAGVAKLRKEQWLAYLEDVLGEKIHPDRVIIKESSDSDSLARVKLKNYQGPPDPEMRGFPSVTRPPFEKKTKWVEVREQKGNIIVELRHDRLFLPGSAYLRDEALPELAQALARVRQEYKKKELVAILNPLEEPLDPKQKKQKEKELKKEEKAKSKEEKKLQDQTPDQTVVLASYSEKVYDAQRNKKEMDPKLAALRSKVLFMLFARERFLD